jgi:prepilin-type N-terminal cleavage/methylation domain-containing protein
MPLVPGSNKTGRVQDRTRAWRTHSPAGDDSGFSLIELLVAVVILGLSVVSIAGMFIVMASTTFLHKEQANVGAVLRSAAEAVAATDYNCTSPATAKTTYDQVAAAVPHPPISTAASVVSVTALDGSALSCSGSPMQLVTVRISSLKQHVTQEVSVVKAPVATAS